MNEAHLHLLLNHTPILGSLFGALLLLFAVLRRNDVLIRAGLLTLVAAAALAIPTNLTGEGAEKVIQRLPGVSQDLIELHSAAADLALWALEATAALALASLLLLDRRPAAGTLLTRLTLAGALVSFGLMARAGNLGGQIRHPETRGDALSNTLGK